MQLHRQTDATRIFEYQCQAEAEEANGAFEPDLRTWYPAAPPAGNAPFDARAGAQLPALTVPRDIPRQRDGKPDLTGWYQPDAGGANYGLETRAQGLPHAREPRHRRRSDRRLAAVSGVGARRARESRAAASRLRRSDRALLRRGRTALAVRARARADPAAAGLRRDAVRADVVAANPARRPRTPAGPPASLARRLASAAGKATRSSSRRAI